MYILWFRHGFSCANYIKAIDNMYLLKMPLEPDAHLTNIGEYQTEAVAKGIIKEVKNKKIRVINLLFTSILTRTIQTANAINKSMGKKFPIIVLPYIEEIPFSIIFPIDRQNHPRNINIIRKDTGIKVETLNVPDLNPYNNYGTPVKRVDIKKFYTIVFPKLIEYLIEEGYKITDNTAIIIVSHRKTISEATDISVGNTGAVLQKIEIIDDDNDMNKSTDSIISTGGEIITGPSQLIFEGFFREESVDMITDENDISNCKSKIGKKFQI